MSPSLSSLPWKMSHFPKVALDSPPPGALLMHFSLAGMALTSILVKTNVVVETYCLDLDLDSAYY